MPMEPTTVALSTPTPDITTSLIVPSHKRITCTLCEKPDDNCFKVSVLPSTAKGILDCARHEIQALENTVEMTEQDEDALDDGFLCIDLNVLTTKLEKWYQLFPTLTPFFAVKCNPDPMVVHWLACHASIAIKKPVGFDCASLAEVEMAYHSLQAAKNKGQNNDPAMQYIVYANPQRAEKDLMKSLELFPTDQPIWLTLDGPEELYKMKQVCDLLGREPSTLKVIVRIFVPDEHSQVPLGEKFGMSLEAIPPLVKTANTLGFSAVGVSFHCGSGCHDPQAYQTALNMAEQAIQIINEEQPDQKCWLLDIGGGFPGWDGVGGDEQRFCNVELAKGQPLQRSISSNGKDAAVDISNAIRPKLQDLESKFAFSLISEPGRYFAEASACLVSRIYKAWEETTGEGENAVVQQVYQIAHGVHGVFKDVLLCDEAFIPKGLRHNSADRTDDSDVLHLSQVRGPSGDSRDLVCLKCMLPKLQIGDWLVFDRAGAYTLSIASRSGRPIIRYVKGSRGPY